MDEHLVLQLGSSDGEVRRTAIETVRRALPAATADVIGLLESDHWQVRASAAAVLDHAEQTDAVSEALMSATRDRDARVRKSAFHSLLCGHCKPDGCLGPTAVERVVEGLLHDPSVRVRRTLAGNLMWGQAGLDDLVRSAFEQILATDTDPTLRERAAAFIASCELPREEMPYREWIGSWNRRKEELASLPA